MPNKTIYISDNDLPVADRAAELAGGLSPAVMEGLKLYIRNSEASQQGYEEVHVVDRSDGVETRKVFQGRQLARLSQSHGGKRIEWTSYLTPKDNLAVVRSEHPDFVAVARGAGAAGPNAERGAFSWDDDASSGSPRATGGPRKAGSRRGSNSRGASLDPEQVTRDVLDFARQTFNGATGRGSRDAGGFNRPTVDVDLSYLMNSVNEIFSDLSGGLRREDRGHWSSPSAREGDSDHGNARAANTGDFEDGKPTESNSGDKYARGFGSAVDHRAGEGTPQHSSDPAEFAEAAKAPEASEFRNKPEASFVSDTWSAQHHLEVFADLDELKEAAFRQANTVPAPFITATERALSTPKTEYLDI